MEKHDSYIYEANDEEYFYPSPSHPNRTATAKSAMFNLISTIIGGGMLSLPYAFSKCGLVLGFVFMLIAAIASDFGLYILVSCSRRSGAQSYEHIALKAFGVKTQCVTMGLLIILTFLSFTGYVILTKDLASSLVQLMVSHELSSQEKQLLTLGCLVVVSPLLLFRSMNSLRFTSIFSLVSILILAIAMGIRTVQSMQEPVFHLSGIKWWPESLADAIYAFPIISVAYMCHFNVLPVYGELHQPTRHRLKNIVHATMASSFLFYILVGVTGYLYAFDKSGGVQDDILKNFEGGDVLINVGRAGLLMTVLLSLPLLLLPCRSTLYRGVLLMSPDAKEETHALLLSESNVVGTDEPSNRVHGLLTIGIVGLATCLAFTVPGVAVVWNIMGSTVGILIAYVLPTICYIRIRHTKSFRDCRKLAAVVLFGCSVATLLVCTFQAFASLMTPL